MQDPDRRRPAQRAPKLHVAALLEREGHPLQAEVAENGGGIGRGKIVGIAAGTMLVAGAVAASALGLSSSAQPHNEAGGVPVPGAAGHGAAGGVSEYPAEQVDNQVSDQAPQTTTPQSAPSSQARPAPAPEHHSTPQKTHHSTSTSASSSQQQAQQPEQQPQQQKPQQSSQPAPQQHSQGGLGKTLQDVVTPVTQTVDDTLQPALSMIPIVGGLLGG